MLKKKKIHPTLKSGLHPRNKHRERYHFEELIKSCPELGPFVRLNQFNDESIDFSNAEAVLLLNKALLKHFYGIEHWNIPAGYLCPPIPGRADYIHRIADVLGTCNNGVIPTGRQIKCLDIGTGANCIYPIIGNKEYGWSFVGSDIDPTALQSAGEIIDKNTSLKGNVELRLQTDPTDVINGIIHTGEQFDITLCNPPFHASNEDALSGTLRKLSNLNHKRITKPNKNFGGSNRELWCEGGEVRFVQTMISQSKEIHDSCLWFTTLIAKQTHLKGIQIALENAGVVEIKTIPMAQGNKASRIVAWTYFTHEQRKRWAETRWAG
jgi:23S rRNA (adenine1618-N6)-methyltransferase